MLSERGSSIKKHSRNPLADRDQIEKYFPDDGKPIRRRDFFWQWIEVVPDSDYLNLKRRFRDLQDAELAHVEFENPGVLASLDELGPGPDLRLDCSRSSTSNNPGCLAMTASKLESAGLNHRAHKMAR